MGNRKSVKRKKILPLHLVIFFVACSKTLLYFPLTGFVDAFVLQKAHRAFAPVHPLAKDTSLSSSPLQLSNNSFYLPPDQIGPIIYRSVKPKGTKYINVFGIYVLLVSLITCPPWVIAMTCVQLMSTIFKKFDLNRALFDKTGKMWSKIWLSLSMMYPTFSGTEHAKLIKGGHGPCIYVANHASWLDIPVLCTCLDNVFKFISKIELRNVPCIGQQLRGGGHILIDRGDRRSQIRTFKTALAYLKEGIPLVGFPEGERSKDGRLLPFKDGIFSMAIKANVPIVPITLSNTHAIMPSYSLFPVQSGKGGKLNVHVHSPIETKGKKEKEISDLVRKAIISELAEDQVPIEDAVEEGES